KRQVLLAGDAQNRARQGMLAALFDGGRQPQHFGLAERWRWNDCCDSGLAFGQSTGLVDDQSVDFLHHLQRVGILDQQSSRGAPRQCARPTLATLCAPSVSRPTRSARMIKVPVPLIVPPIARSLALFATGIGSPEIMDSSTALCPSRTTPSTGIFSPGRTRSL